MGKKFNNTNSEGYVLIGVLFVVMLSVLIIAGSINVAQTDTHIVYTAKKRTENYYEIEQTLTEATSWLRANSTGIALLFSRSNFYNNFDRSAPSVGTNDVSGVSVPTKIKRQGTSESIMLASDNVLGTNYFPSSTDTITGAAFNPVTSFTGQSFTKGKVRVTLIDAIAADPSKDYGDTDSGNAAPATEFHPVYRVDSLTDLTQGTHLLGYLTGTLQFDYGVGFYGRTLVDFRQGCDSYLSNNGAYSNANKRANCTVGGNSIVQVQQTNTIYGTLRTNGTINTNNPYGGKICADFTGGCPNAGVTCQGAACAVPDLPAYNAWNSYCPTNQGNLSINSNSTLTVPGNAANQKCWSTVTIGNNRTLTLTSTAYPYFIDTFSIPNTGRINFAPNPANGTINLYVKKFAGDSFNGNQVFNVNNKPYQLRIHYLGTDDLTLNGTAAMSSFLVAPYAGVTISGNFTYSGGVKALSLSATGSGALHYDESGDITTISDVTYHVKNVTQVYR